MYKPDPKGYEYEHTIPYGNEQDMENTIYEIMSEASNTADLRNDFIEAIVFAMDDSDRSW